MESSHGQTFERYRGYLFGIAYRMLGSAMEAEDMVQETFLRWRAAELASVAHPRAFLATIITRLCINQMESSRHKRESYIGPWLPEPVLDSQLHLVEQDESVSLAFLVLLEQLTAAERAVFILRELFDFSYREIAVMLVKSETACRQLFSRAQRHIKANQPRFETTPERHEQLLQRFLAVINGQDLSTLTDMLAEDVIFWGDGGGKVPGATRRPIYGKGAVARFLLGVVRFGPAEPVVTVRQINGLPTMVVAERNGPVAFVLSLDVLADEIAGIRVIANPDKLRALG